MIRSMLWNLVAAANLFAGFFAAVLYVFYYFYSEQKARDGCSLIHHYMT